MRCLLHGHLPSVHDVDAFLRGLAAQLAPVYRVAVVGIVADADVFYACRLRRLPLVGVYLHAIIVAVNLAFTKSQSLSFGLQRIVPRSVWHFRASCERYSFCFILAGFPSLPTAPHLTFAFPKIKKNPHSRIISSMKCTEISFFVSFRLFSPLIGRNFVILHLHSTKSARHIAQLFSRIATSERINEQTLNPRSMRL